MASLKEIKGRIASVSSTLKITSAMKLVASAKLRKAQQAILNMLPYEEHLQRILTDVVNCLPEGFPGTGTLTGSRVGSARRVAIVAFSSNSSLCGAFNSNVIKEVHAVINEYVDAGLGRDDIVVYSVGRKMQEAMRKAGFISPLDCTRMADSPSYEAASVLAHDLVDRFSNGSFDKVELVYNHFKTTASQVVMRETYLPINLTPDASRSGTVGKPNLPDDIIIEPSAQELLEDLLPKVVRLRIFTTLLDSNAAEHAARTVAMQTATDNGNDLLEELTLEYNKGRQQKITSEILDIVGGSLS